MSSTIEAEQHLRVIRSLMEKATLYRALSAPGALTGGLASLVATAIGCFFLPSLSNFFVIWCSVLLFTLATNLLLLRKDAQRRNEPFLSSGMRLAARALLPALFGGGLSIFLNHPLNLLSLTTSWILFYGISLLAASHFAPPAIRNLGIAFFTAALVVIPIGSAYSWTLSPQITNSNLLLGFHFTSSEVTLIPNITAAHLLMGATFGLFHIIYAICTWPRSSAS